MAARDPMCSRWCTRRVPAALVLAWRRRVPRRWLAPRASRRRDRGPPGKPVVCGRADCLGGALALEPPRSKRRRPTRCAPPR